MTTGWLNTKTDVIEIGLEVNRASLIINYLLIIIDYSNLMSLRSWTNRKICDFSIASGTSSIKC